MNFYTDINDDHALTYQTRRFQEILSGMVHCCDERMAEEAKRLGMPTSEMECLRLFNGERYLTAKGIAGRLDVAKSRITKIIDGLLAKDMVSRTDDPNDARIKLIGLTLKGERKASEIENIIMENHRQVLLQIPEHDRNGVLAAMETLRSSMEVVKAELE